MATSARRRFGARGTLLALLAIFLLGADVDDVLDADARRRAAQVDADVGALDALLAEDLLYVHSTGEVHAKEELITWLEQEEADYVAIETSEVDVLVDGGVAKLVGWQSMEVRVGEEVFRPRSVFTAVYVQRDGRWQLFAYQSTPLPAPSPAAEPPATTSTPLAPTEGRP
jgi:hypothetical protein